MKITTFCDITQCSLVEADGRQWCSVSVIKAISDDEGSTHL
jgi:hypothetical protein